MIAYRPAEAARVIGLSRDEIFAALRGGSLHSMKVNGGVRLVTLDALKKFIARHKEGQAPTIDRELMRKLAREIW